MNIRTLFFNIFMLCLSGFILAETRYNPVNNLIYSHPETSEINQNEYRFLCNACFELNARMRVAQGKIPSNSAVLNQCIFYLQSVNTPTALRLIADLKQDVIRYANGDFLGKIFLV